MAVDLWNLMTTLHPPGATTQYCSPTGSSSNPGTFGSRTNVGTAWGRITAAGGGVIILGDGNYGTINVSGNFSNSSWAIIKAENRFGANVTAAHAGNGSYIGFWGLKSVDTGVDHNFPMDVGHHYAAWCCWAGGGTSGGFSVAGNFGYVNNISFCYNIAERCSWNFFGSGMSLYQLSNYVGSVDHTWINGYDNILVGNICQDNFNGPQAEQSDGNGIILDDMWNTQTNYSVQPNVRYLGNFLLLGNLSVFNGGVGLHNLSTDNVDYYFNTVANNGRMFGNAFPGDKSNLEGTGAEMDAVCGVYGERLTTPMRVRGNLVRAANVGSGWFNNSTATNVQASDNAIINGVDNMSSRDRRSTGWNYLATNPPTLTPRLDTVAQWLPDGGSGAIETATISGATLTALVTFPDLLGTARPAGGTWTIGALETTSSGENAPTASFTATPNPVAVGQPVQFTDTSSGPPTSWSWNFGDGGAQPNVVLPQAGLNGSGHFSGRILIDDVEGMADCIVKVVNAYHPNWTLGTISTVLGTTGGHDGVDVFVTTTDANGYWSVTGLSPSKYWMLKIFPTHPDDEKCVAHAVIEQKYIGNEAGWINTAGGNFMSTPTSPGSDTYNIYAAGRFLFDMPTHVFPAGDTPLIGSTGLSDLNVRFYTRTGSFPTSGGTHSGCSPVNGGGNPSGTSTSQNPSYTFAAVGSYTVTLTATNAFGSSATTRIISVTESGGDPEDPDPPTNGATIFQAEDAALTSNYPNDPYAIHDITDNPGYAGSGYVGFFGQTGEKITWTFTAPNGAGTYEIAFRFRNGDVAATRTIWRNGTSLGTLGLPKNATAFTANTWSLSSPITTTLNAGQNTIEMVYSGAGYTGYVDIDYLQLSGGGTPATVAATAIAARTTVPGPSIGTATVLNASVAPPSIAAPAALPAPSYTRTATVPAVAVAAFAYVENSGLYGDIPIIDATVEATSVAATARIPSLADGVDIEAMRMLAGRFRLLGATRQRTTG